MHQILIFEQAQWTSSSTQRACGRNIHYSTEMYWFCEVYSYWSGCAARKEDWRLLECRSSKHLSDSWREFTKFTLLKKKLPRGYVWSGRDWQTFRRLPDQIFIWPEEWTKIGKAIHNREKQDWEKENQKLDNARKLRGLYFIDPDDREYSEILKNTRRK